MSLDTDNVKSFTAVFAALEYDANATRCSHVQAGGFVWSDEKPSFDVDGNFPIAISNFMIYLISYRATIMRGKPHEPFTPIWNAFQSMCPTWPGFRPERNNPDLSSELETELDAQYDYLDRALEICERKKTRDDHKNQTAKNQPNPNPDAV